MISTPKNSEYILYLDMDGVMVDFDGGFGKISNGNTIKQYSKLHGDNAARDQYLKAGLEFWTNLTWIRGGKELWDAASGLFERVHILSSAGTRDEEKAKVVELGKRQWLKNNIPSIPASQIFIVRGKHRKQEYAAKNSILVDDVILTIKQWNSHGGYGILHNSSNYKKTIEDLEDISRPIKISEIIKRFRK